MKVKPHDTSQICSCCNRFDEKDLSVRIHECLCGLVLDRECDSFSLNLATRGRLASVE
ncbi:zinc ribbon domain-containing protein [Coleofasciculus sp.]|uniref:zinc ribbon domain-containing protein n=1 Tax=Coleofasciculus sp. TaxID=3100458 RepID=UPI0039F83D0E